MTCNGVTRLVAHITCASAAALLLESGALAQVGKSIGIVDANVATPAELAAMPHVTPALAEAIVAARPIPSITELDALLSKSLSRLQIMNVYERLFVHLDLNRAAPAQMLLIPRISTRLVRELQFRAYESLADFRRITRTHVDDKERARLEQYVFVPIPLNTATDADFLTIPNLGPRMLREFKEWRPYAKIDRFREAMGKYVDQQEVARLERYVFVDCIGRVFHSPSQC